MKHKLIESKDYINNANVIINDNVLRFKGINYNIVQSKISTNNTKYYCAIANRNTGNKNITMIVHCLIHTDNITTVFYSKYEII